MNFESTGSQFAANDSRRSKECTDIKISDNFIFSTYSRVSHIVSHILNFTQISINLF